MNKIRHLLDSIKLKPISSLQTDLEDMQEVLNHNQEVVNNLHS